MKKNEIFTFKAPNGAEVTAVVVHTIFQGNAKCLGYKEENEGYDEIVNII